MGNLLDELQESRKLPCGHVEKKRAKEAVDREYEKSHKQELSFRKCIPKQFRKCLEIDRVREVVSSLCSLTGTREPKVIFNSTQVHPMAVAHCDCVKKELHFTSYIKVDIIIHELAHYIAYMDKRVISHGEEFLWVEQFLFGIFMDEILPIWKQREQGLV